jgi:UDP-glucose 4-epimerase
MRPVLARRRVLVTGGAGLIGSHIVEAALDARAAEVVVLDDFSRGTRDNLATALSRGRVRIVEGDIRDRGLLRELMHGVDVVFHEAAIRITQCAAEPRRAFEVLAEGAFDVYEAAAAARVRKVVTASSASIYGMAEQFPTPEDHHPYNNRTLYGAAKAFNEALLRTFHAAAGLDYVALRYFNVYGPRMDTHGAYTEVFIRWMDRIASGQPPIVFGDGTQTMDFVYVEDVARANIYAAVAPATDVAVNIGTGVETSLAQLAAALMRAMGARLPLEHAPARAVNGVVRRLADVERARRLLGWHASVSLEEGLRRLVDWWSGVRVATRRAEAARVA